MKTHFPHWSLKINTFKNQQSISMSIIRVIPSPAQLMKLFFLFRFYFYYFFAECSISPTYKGRIPWRSAEVHLSKIEGLTYKEISPM